MDGLSEFSVLAFFGFLTTHSPLSKDHSWVSVIKFYVTILLTIFVTLVIWGLIGYLGSKIYIPLRLDMAVLFTLTGFVLSFAVFLSLVSHGVESIDKHIRSALQERHVKHDMGSTRTLLPH